VPTTPSSDSSKARNSIPPFTGAISRTGPTFHIDYVFVPKVTTNLMQRVSVGSYAKWIAKGLSDHAPVIVDFLPGFAARLTSGNPSRS
jgi:endonuclease/exonuclease/phosphatase family metal-dependent hydrolase